MYGTLYKLELCRRRRALHPVCIDQTLILYRSFNNAYDRIKVRRVYSMTEISERDRILSIRY